MSIGLGTTPDAPVSIPSTNKGLINFVSNSELDRMEDERRKALQPTKVEVPLGTLANHVRAFLLMLKLQS